MSGSVLSFVQQRFQFLWKKAFVRDVFALQVGGVFTHGLGFAKSIILARLLGLEGFGVYATALALTGVLKIFTGFGQEQAFLTYIAEEYEKNNTAGMQSVIKYYCLMAGLAGTVLLLLALASPVIAASFYDEHVAAIGSMAQIAFVAFFIGLSHPLALALLQTVRAIRLMTFLENLNLTMQLGFAVAFLLMGFGPLGVFLGLLTSNVIMTALYGYHYFRLRQQHGFPSLWDSLHASVSVRQYLKHGLWISLDKNVVNVFPQALLFLFSLVAPVSSVGIGQLAIKMSNLPAGLFLAHTVRLSKTVLQKFKEEGQAQLRKQCVLLIKHTFLFHSLIIFGCMVAFPPLILFFYGMEFAGVITPMLWMLLVRLLQPFSVANVALFRLFRKVSVSMYWNALRIPLILGLFWVMLQGTGAGGSLYALVVAVYLYQVTALLINWYVYRVLLQIRVR